MFEVMFTPVGIGAIVGLVLALVFAYFPKLRVWFAALASEKQSYLRLGLLLLAEIVISLLSYYQVITTVPPFSFATALNIALALIVANQPTSVLLPETKDVTEARILRDVAMTKLVVKRQAK